ncbi:MAG: tyrosine-protein kinase family protein [Gemmataceae bacterium]
MYVITFYSFKGGVGRTMALVNVAAELVRRGRKVLVVDFDLEAPGLETYKQLRPKEPHPGIVEYVTEFRRTQAVPDLHEYMYEAKPIGKRGGRLWVMPAGRRDRAYRNALTDLDWKRLYQDEGGFLLFEDTKKGWEKELKPDYVLIDSRTGDTDVLGICTRQLPDAVVLMFMPNQQNLAGLKNVVRDIRREETEGLKKKIQLHFVAANVPRLDDEEGILKRRLHRFEKALHFPKLDNKKKLFRLNPMAPIRFENVLDFNEKALHFPKPDGVIDRYDSLLHLDQRVFVLERPRSKLARQYRRLVQALRFHNPFDGVAWKFQYLVLKRNFTYLKAMLGDRLPADIRRPLEQIMFFHVMMIWRYDGEIPEGLGREIVALAEEIPACQTTAADCQALALFYLQLGDRVRAKEYIQKSQSMAPSETEMSYWRCIKASPEQFREDCRQIERLIDGEPLQPLFLADTSRPEPGEPNTT